MEETGTCH